MTINRDSHCERSEAISTFSIAFILLLFAGCAGINFKTTDVSFEDPILRLGIQSVDPNSEELAGIELNQNPSFEKPLEYHEENKLYAQIKNQQGISMQFKMNRKDLFRPGSRPDTFIVLSQTDFENEGGKLFEEKELTRKDEIVKFIRGNHNSKIGKFTITDWKRTPSLPAGPVKIGDSWAYEEKMDVKVDSFWIKQVPDSSREQGIEPYTMKAKSTLAGFAMIRGVRCAVVKTEVNQIKREHFKVMFKKIEFQIHAQMRISSYWDYKSGRLVAQIAKTDSQTQGINISLTDTGQSQSILALQ